MTSEKRYFIHIYYNFNQIHDILFNCILPLYKENTDGRKFNFMYFTDNKRGEHVKLLFEFENPVTREWYVENILQKVESFIKENKSDSIKHYSEDFLAPYSNNYIKEFEFNPEAFLVKNEELNDALIKLISKYTPYILPYREGYDLDNILSSSIIISNIIISSFHADNFEKADYFEWVFKEIMPTVHYYSKKDKDIRQQKLKERKEKLDNFRRNYFEQKAMIKMMVDHYSSEDIGDTDFAWLLDFKEELDIIVKLITDRKYPVPDYFKYQSNIQTSFIEQEKWPVIERLMYCIFTIYGCSEDLTLNILFLLKEHYKNEEKVLLQHLDAKHIEN